MSELINTLRAIIRDELMQLRAPELGIVLAVYANDADGNNHQVDLRLQSSGVELKRVPVTVQRNGLSALPRIDDLVVVIFVGGELNAPLVIGSLYDDQQHPPEATPTEVVYQVPDEGGERHIYLETPSGMNYTINDSSLTVVAGGTEILIEQDGNVEIRAAGNISLSADGDISLEAGGNLNFKAANEVSIEAMTISNQANAEAAHKAPVIKLAGMAQFSPG